MQDSDTGLPRIRDAQGTWVVYALGGIFGETSRALFVGDTDATAIVYVPREDMAMAFFDRSDRTTTDPAFGAATWYALDTKSQLLADAAWSFEAPPEAAAALKGYLAFDEAQVTVERQA